MCLYTIFGAGAVGLGILLAPESVRSTLGMPPRDDVVTFGITGSVYLAFALLSLLGLRSPLKYSPVLLLALTAAIYATCVVGDVIAIPFRHLFAGEPGGPT